MCVKQKRSKIIEPTIGIRDSGKFVSGIRTSMTCPRRLVFRLEPISGNSEPNPTTLKWSKVIQKYLATFNKI